jgi:hypothetical protein
LFLDQGTEALATSHRNEENDTSKRYLRPQKRFPNSRSTGVDLSKSPEKIRRVIEISPCILDHPTADPALWMSENYERNLLHFRKKSSTNDPRSLLVFTTPRWYRIHVPEIWWGI